MRRKRLILGVALVALALGYVELRLPGPVGAQGRDAVYQRVAVTSTDASAVRVAGGIEVGDDVDVDGALTVTGAVNLEAFRGLIAAFNGAMPRRLGRNDRARRAYDRRPGERRHAGAKRRDSSDGWCCSARRDGALITPYSFTVSFDQFRRTPS